MMTSQQALAQYHLAYNNEAYHNACAAIEWVLIAGTQYHIATAEQMPEAAQLANLLTDTALEICGHPAYKGQGWTLAFKLYELAADRLERGAIDSPAIQRMFTAVDAYLDLYRQQMVDCEAMLHSDPFSKTTFQMEGGLSVLEEIVCTASHIPSRNGRSAYHLTAACAGLLRTAALILKEDHAPSAYTAEKFSRALHDLLYALNEISQYQHLPHTFTTARESLTKLLEEK